MREFLEDYIELIQIFCFVMGFVFVLALLFGTAAYFISRYDCSKLEQNIGRDTEYHFWGGECLVRVNNQLTPYKQWVNNSGI